MPHSKQYFHHPVPAIELRNAELSKQEVFQGSGGVGLGGFKGPWRDP